MAGTSRNGSLGLTALPRWLAVLADGQVLVGDAGRFVGQLHHPREHRMTVLAHSEEPGLDFIHRLVGQG